MKLNEMAWANASGVFMGIIYVACALLIGMFPDLSKRVAGSWFHGLNIDLIWNGMPRSNFLLGLVSAVGLSWLSGYLFAYLYNKFAKG